MLFLNRMNLFSLVRRILMILFLALLCFFTLFPVLYALLGSFKTNMELVGGGRILPSQWQFQNYEQAFVQSHFLEYAGNSLLISIGSMIIALITTSLAGYALARHKFPLKRLLNVLYVGLMFISLGAVTLFPVYRLLSDLGLTRTPLGLMLVLTGGQASNVLLVRGFCQSVPRELDEAALLDGCGYYRFFFDIMLPLIRPILAVVALFTFRNTWNDYVTSLIMTIAQPRLMTLTVAVVQLKYSMNAAAEWHIMMAGASLALLPMLIVYLLCNRQFIAGLTAGAVKG